MSRARTVAHVAGVLSRVVGGVSAIECAANAVSATDDETSLAVALTAAIHHRRQHADTYGAAWSHVTDRQARECVAAVGGESIKSAMAALKVGP